MIKIAIRADGGPKIGMGHITRCLALAEELAGDNCIITFIIKRDETTIDLISSKGFKTIALPRLSFDEEINFMKIVVKCFDILITDSYDIDLKYLMEMKNTGIYLITIDDLNHLESYPSDVVINGNIYAEDLNYKSTYGNTQFLLGPEYILLRKEFIGLSQRKINKKCNNILITMGGSDPVHFSLSISEQLIDLGIKLHVVIGPAFDEQYKSFLMDFASHHGNVSLYKSLPADRMRDLMLKADVGISAGGSTLYELAATGTPTIALIAADNQLMNVKKMSSLHMINVNNDIADIKNDTERLINDFDERSRLCNSMKDIFNISGHAKIKEIILGHTAN